MSKKKMESNSLLHNATRKMLFCYRIVGLFPLEGLMQHNIENLRFNPYSLNMVLFSISFILKLIETLLDIYQLSESVLTIRLLVETACDIMHFIRSILLLRLAYEWPELLKVTSTVERNLRTNKRKVTKQSDIVLILFNIVKIFNNAFNLWHYLELSVVCTKDGRVSPFKSFVIYISPDIFGLIAYETWIGVILTMHLCQNLYVEDLFDIFIMQISIYLKSYFEDFNRRVKKIAKTNTKNFAWIFKTSMSEPKDVDWGALRIEYTQMSRLVIMVNDKISGMVLLSFGTNIILLWSQLLMLIRRGQFVDQSKCDAKELDSSWTMYNYSRNIYIYVAVLVLVFRFFLSSLLASNINSAAKECALTLYEISESIRNNVEMNRLISQIRTSTVALSGLGFFHVTKGMMLSMGGTIVTYELMMLQFAPATHSNLSIIENSTDIVT